MPDLFNNIYDQASTQYGLPKDWLPTFARIESGGNPQATTGSYKGLFQLSDPEFAKHGQGNIYDPQANTYAAASKLKGEFDNFKTKYGRDPTASDLYLIHQQGEGGYAAHTSNPDRPAWQNMLSTAEGQQKGAAWAKQAIWGNVPDDVKAQYGSVDNITSKQFADLWTNKVARMSGAPGSGPTLASTLAQGGNKMPDPVTGEYTPEDVIAARRRQAGMAQAEAVPGGKWGPLAGLLQGIGAGVTGNQADTYSRGNQAMQQAAGRRAAGATSQQELISALMESGVPGYADMAIKSRASSLDPGNSLDLQTKQLALENARTSAPLQQEKTKAEIKALGQKDVLNEAIANMVRGALPQGASEPVAPGYQPLPPSGMRLQSGEAPTDPNIIRTQAVTPGPQAAPAPQPTQDMVDTPYGRMTRDKARQLGGALALAGKGDAGKMLIEAAGAAPGSMAKATQHDIDKDELGYTKMLGSFSEIQRQYDPKFLQGSQKITYALNNIRDKWTPDTLKKLQLNPQEAQELRKYEQFSATAMNNLNTRLKELSGTAVTETEMQRILRELPSPGTGPFSGDGPVAFKAKLDQGIRMAKLAVARTRFLRSNGFTGDVNAMASSVPLDEMPNLIDRRGAEIMQKMKSANPDVPDDQLIPKAVEATKREFGI